MKTLDYWEEMTETMDDCDEDGNGGITKMQWYCSDGISTYWGDTKAEAASHFGVPVGNF